MSHISGLQMEEEQSHMTEMIYDLALEIIFLLTGEKHAAVKIVSIESLLRDVYPPLSIGGSLSTMPITKRPSHPQIPKSNNQKILEVTGKIMELLAGEVSEDKEDPYLRGDQVNDEMNIKEEPEELYVRGDEWVTDRETSTALPAVSAPEDYRNLHHYQDENLVNVKLVSETHVMGVEWCKEEEIDPHISADWGFGQSIQEQPFDNGHMQNANDFTESSDVTNLPSAQVHQMSSFAESGRGFSARVDIITHKQLPNDGKSCTCLICGKLFSQKKYLKAHLPIHSEEKPYSCSECGKSFSRKSTYITHMRVHTGEKPYSCSQCGRCFSQSAHLLAHKRRHTGERPYSCPECGRRFTQRSTFIRHRKAHAVR